MVEIETGGVDYCYVLSNIFLHIEPKELLMTRLSDLVFALRILSKEVSIRKSLYHLVGKFTDKFQILSRERIAAQGQHRRVIVVIEYPLELFVLNKHQVFFDEVVFPIKYKTLKYLMEKSPHRGERIEVNLEPTIVFASSICIE